MKIVKQLSLFEKKYFIEVEMVKPKIWNFEVIKGKNAWKEVVYSARMSGVPSKIREEKVFKMLVKNDYGSALEHIIVKFDIKMAKGTAPELLEHRIACLGGRTQLIIRYKGKIKYAWMRNLYYLKDKLKIEILMADGLFKKIKGFARYPYPGYLYKITLMNGASIVTDPSHLNFTQRGIVKTKDLKINEDALLFASSEVQNINRGSDNPRFDAQGNKWMLIKNIERVRNLDGYIYNIEIDKPHLFRVANGIITHNSHTGYSTRYIKVDKGLDEQKERYEIIMPWHLLKLKKNDPRKQEFFNEIKSKLLLYEKLLKEKIPRESARYILPFSQAVGIYHFTINLRSLLNLLSLRFCVRASPEFRCIAGQLYFNLIKQLPILRGFVGCRGFMKGVCPENEVTGVRKGEQSPIYFPCLFKNPDTDIFIPTSDEMRSGIKVPKFNLGRALKAQEAQYKIWAKWG